MERIKSCIVGIDALCQCGAKQIFIKPMLRELIKSYVGFSCNEKILKHKYLNGVATGNWGCGVFGGDPQIKFMLQWISITLSGHNLMNYYIKGNNRISNVQQIIDIFKKNGINTVGQLWKILMNKELCEKYENQKVTLFGFISQMFGVKEVVNLLQVPFSNMKNK